ncbi:coenzyme F390 synthetase [Verrucomicrobia bacterium IMCC26134]|jgi:phenylacetate-CoA ligase|nr:coenzyme F390 synthetase [Verrucomicrobia bacterium IMCC26134]
MFASASPLFANDPELITSAAGRLPASLEGEIRRIYERSPLYSKRFPLHSEALHWGCYRDIPALTKRDIVTHGHEAFFDDYRVIERGLQENRYEYESTSGTTAGPMTVIMEQGWWNAQTVRAYRAHPLLAPYADRAHRKCVLAPVGCSSNLCPYEDHPFPHRYFDGVVYLNLTSDPFVFPEAEWDRILGELQAVKPEIIEGEPIYLSLLARAALRRGIKVPSVRVVILTYGKASLQHSRRIAEAFPAAQVDLYGSTEAGYIFVGEAFEDDSRVIDENVFVELAPFRGLPDVFQLYVTTRDRQAMPLLRYHAGDVVRRLPTGFRVLGREGGLHFRADGSVVSPTEVDAALPADFACWHYSLVQTGPQRWDFHYVADVSAPGGLEAALASMLGDGARVSAFRRRLIAPASSGKFALLKPLVV